MSVEQSTVDEPGRPTLARLWSEQLGHRDIPGDADFFTLGGDSLTVSRLARRMSQEFGVTVSIRALLAARTLDEQSDLIAARLRDAEEVHDGH
jgi:aryl carrier-like protein